MRFFPLQHSENATEETNEGLVLARADDSGAHGFRVARPIAKGSRGEIAAQALENLQPWLGRSEPEKSAQLVVVEMAHRGAFQFQQVRLRWVDVDRVDLAGILQQQRKRVACTGGDGDERFAGLDRQGSPVRCGIFPTHPKEQIKQLYLILRFDAHRPILPSGRRLLQRPLCVVERRKMDSVTGRNGFDLLHPLGVMNPLPWENGSNLPSRASTMPSIRHPCPTFGNG